MGKIILVAGATGNLGMRIVKYLSDQEAEVRVIVRSDTDNKKIEILENYGAKIFKVNDWNMEALKFPCQDVSCVISSLAGLREVLLMPKKCCWMLL